MKSNIFRPKFVVFMLVGGAMQVILNVSLYGIGDCGIVGCP